MINVLFSSFMMSGENDCNVLLLLHNYLYTECKNGDTNQETVNDRNPIHLTQSCITRNLENIHCLTYLQNLPLYTIFRTYNSWVSLPVCRTGGTSSTSQHLFVLPVCASLFFLLDFHNILSTLSHWEFISSSSLFAPLFSFSWTSIISFQLYHTGNS